MTSALCLCRFQQPQALRSFLLRYLSNVYDRLTSSFAEEYFRIVFYRTYWNTFRGCCNTFRGGWNTLGRWLEYVPNLLEYVREVVGIRSEPIRIRWGGGRNTFGTYWNTLGRWLEYVWNLLEYVEEVVGIGSERITTTSERIRGAFSSRSFPPPLRPIRHRKHMTPIHTRILRLLCIR